MRCDRRSVSAARQSFSVLLSNCRSSAAAHAMGHRMMPYMQNPMDHFARLANISKEFAGNQTRILEEIQKVQFHATREHVEKKELESSVISLKVLVIFVGVLAVLAIGGLCWLLRDEYRQAQLKKKGYGTVPTHS